MNFDRNTVIGFIILALLFFGFFYYNSQQQAAAQKEKARIDSIAKSHQPRPDPVAVRKDSLAADSVKNSLDSGKFQIHGTEQISTVENDLIKVAFTNKGAQPKWVELKKFKGPDSNNVKLAATDFDKITYPIITGNNQTR